MPASQLCLVSLLHDPEGLLRPLATPLIERWLDRYGGIVILTSSESYGQTGELLTSKGVRVIADRKPQGAARLGQVRLRALQAALEGNYAQYLLIDFDRLVHWETCFPNELRQVERVVADYDFVVMGRSRRAFESHPEVQRETERLANRAFATITGTTIDVLGGARALSARGVRALLQHSTCPDVGVDGEWPILCRRLGLRVAYLATEGLAYETADRYQDLIGQIGYQRWLDRYVHTPENWEQRLRFAYQVAAAARAAAERDLAPEKRPRPLEMPSWKKDPG